MLNARDRVRGGAIRHYQTTTKPLSNHHQNTTVGIGSVGPHGPTAPPPYSITGIAKSAQTEWRPGIHGAPLIDGSLTWFECARHQAVEAGEVRPVAGYPPLTTP